MSGQPTRKQHHGIRNTLNIGGLSVLPKVIVLAWDRFDEIVEAGYDYIVFTGDGWRLTSSVEDWQDFGEIEGDSISLRTSRMERG